MATAAMAGAEGAASATEGVPTVAAAVAAAVGVHEATLSTHV